MKKLNKYLLCGAAAMSLGLAGVGVSAQPANQQEWGWGCGYGQGPGFGPGGGQGMGRNRDGAQRTERMQQYMKQHQAALHDRLKLNPQQEAAWKTYTDATAKNMAPPSWNPAEMASLTAPQRMDRMLERMNERQQRMAAQAEAVKAFYATLTPEQQKIFDDEWMRGPRRMRRGPR